MQWSYRNIDRLWSLVSAEDKEEFGFDIRQLKWKEYIEQFCMGTKIYLFKEDVANLPLARKRLRRSV